MKLIKFILNLLLMAITMSLISSCGAGLPDWEEQTGKTRLVDMGSYKIRYPVGDDWSCKKDNYHKSVQFTREKVWWSGVVLGETSVIVFENEIKTDSNITDDKLFADEYMKTEIKVLKEENAGKSGFEVDDIARFDTLINSKKFYCMTYTTDWGSFLEPMTMESILALYYPPNFSTSHIFYTFLIDDSKKSGSFTENDAGQLYPVLKSFKIKK